MMDRQFFVDNRKALYEAVESGSLIIMYSGLAPRKTNDEDYPFFTNRNFLYLTGIEQANTILTVKVYDNEITEKLYILPPDLIEERWTGRRIKAEEAEKISGIKEYAFRDEFESDLINQLYYGDIQNVYMDFDPAFLQEGGSDAHRLAARICKEAPHISIRTLRPRLKELRTIKKPCEIEAMRKAEIITGAGIEAMMRASKPGMYEYQYKAEFDYALAQRGVLNSGFPSIISAGKNNFCIHYYDYKGQAKDGDMILNDVGAVWDYEINDVSRAFPCNGKFSDRQKLLYECAYNTSEYMFSIIKPGMPMQDVDKTIKEYNFEQMRQAKVLDSFDEIKKYMWHGGAHHVGFDVHDVVHANGLIKPGMVFCVDIGIYHEEWGIGFRLEDNCLVTENGCENLSAAIPRTIEEIEAVMGRW